MRIDTRPAGTPPNLRNSSRRITSPSTTGAPTTPRRRRCSWVSQAAMAIAKGNAKISFARTAMNPHRLTTKLSGVCRIINLLRLHRAVGGRRQQRRFVRRRYATHNETIHEAMPYPAPRPRRWPVPPPALCRMVEIPRCLPWSHRSEEG
jgi:hypothetical protein